MRKTLETSPLVRIFRNLTVPGNCCRYRTDNEQEQNKNITAKRKATGQGRILPLEGILSQWLMTSVTQGSVLM